MANSESRMQLLLDEGTLTFSVESRVLRELGERLVKTPEVAVVELIKNSYDADATECVVSYGPPESIVVRDDGSGMTLDQFIGSWMRIGTSTKELQSGSTRFSRVITGEKGIGRFAVRFLGRSLLVETVADDLRLDKRTKLTARFDWPEFDHNEDLGDVRVPYHLEEVGNKAQTGTKLKITNLRSAVEDLSLDSVRTGSIGVLSPMRSLFEKLPNAGQIDEDKEKIDPGFILRIQTGTEAEEEDVASQVLDSFVLRSKLRVRGDKYELRVFRRDSSSPYLKIIETYPNEIGTLNADIRFFPRRTGTFTDMPLDGRRAQGWITGNHGVAVFDRNFRVPPYGFPRNDWLKLQIDRARNRRDPRSQLARKHFEMSAPVKADPSQNWMLLLPYSRQLVGLVQVQGNRIAAAESVTDDAGLIASADRQGFVENTAFEQLRDLVRGAVEAIAFVDRKLQIERTEKERREAAETLRVRTKAAIREIRANPDISAQDKRRIISALTETESLAEAQRAISREREQQLEVMSLLGVVAGFMTHEFGSALSALRESRHTLMEAGKTVPQLRKAADQLSLHIDRLKEFVTYSSGYIRGARRNPDRPYPARPRLQQVVRVFGKYAEQRNISVTVRTTKDLIAPQVPVSLYGGLALNLYTNALKAVTARLGNQEGKITFRAWNEGRWHYLEVSDNGIGIPSVLHERVFEPLFTTTDRRKDPLGSGMGLGLAFVRRGAEAFGGRAEVVDPPSGYSTCVRVRLPLLIDGVKE